MGIRGLIGIRYTNCGELHNNQNLDFTWRCFLQKLKLVCLDYLLGNCLPVCGRRVQKISIRIHLFV